MITAVIDKKEKLNARQGGAWAYVSASRLSLWSRCPLAWKFRYIDRIRSPTSPSLFLGKVVQAQLEVFYRHRQLGIDLDATDLESRLDAKWATVVGEENMKFDSVLKETNLKEKASGLVAAYVQQVPEDEPLPIAVEATMEVPVVDPVTGENLGIPMLGVVDLILDNPLGATVIDFKTAANAAPLLEISHEVQLSCYSLMFRSLTGKQESSLEIRRLVKTKEPKIEVWPYPARKESHFSRLFALIRAYLDFLDAGKFEYRPSWACSMCNFRRTHCRDWQG